MIGFTLAILAGILISLQSVFNTKVNENVGQWLTTTCVLGIGLISSVLFYIITEKSISVNFYTTNYLFYVSGLFGIGLIICIMGAIKSLGPAYTVLISLITQLVVALCIDTFGLFGMESIPLQINKLVGIGLLIIGIGIFKNLFSNKKSIKITEGEI
ncbi:MULTISPECIES: DMT family transporter [Bacillus]|uniref:Transporter family-2 protein n=1 Tax=Bacillus thuringiensis TaxID=1428 RepID=A0A4R4BE95_BACTU|nr:MULTISPECIES: DMT family transporter [Bacillus]AZJ23626.1 EamA-like transporter family protein [Bacillus wiedmannii bv. thuringiensis]MCU5330023.1 DMT family transporter [Bacillus wiedmannii]PEF41876.1 EamA-like transporter family protein [Bacillus wiedmannii]PEL86821.1 EamA-like transporter family protein [Bacillus wiedmannii]QWH66442.1 DMT family transporter [Bacillus wiedmannii]